MSTSRKIGYVFYFAGVILLMHVPTREFYGILALWIGLDIQKKDDER